jgi:peptidyl-prolyl cis-trans isomerase B (cyclophilin B)
VPTNEQRRETAKRKLERQLERRAKQARMRRILVIVGGTVAAVAVVAAVVITVMNDHDKHKGNNAAPSSASNSPSSSASSASPTEPAGNAAPLPPFKASPSVGADCQYQATPQEPAAKPTKLPRTGKVPTDPAQVSASMSTSQGNMGLMLANNESPCTVNSFASLIGQKYFDNTKCHRLTTSQSLGVLQCGDPKGDGTGGPGYQFANEYPTDQYPPNDPKLQQPVVYPRGTLAMANAGPGTNGSQFFMVYKDSELPPQYTVFGTIQADGLTVLDKIAQAGIKGGGDDGPPANEVLIKSILLD